MREYVITAGRREVGRVESISAYEALREFLTRRGARLDEITTYGPDKLCWLGSVHRAVPAPGPTLLLDAGEAPQPEEE